MSDPNVSADSNTHSATSRRGVPGLIVAAAVLAAAALAGGVAWWLQDARVQAREQARAEAVSQLEKTAALLKTAEATAATAAQQLKAAQVTVDTATKQAADATSKLDAAQRDAAGARAERDQARAATAAAKVDLDRMRANDVDPGLLPTMELAKTLGGLRQVRAVSVLQRNGTAPALDESSLDAALASGLAQAGLQASPQSPFQARLFVTVGGEQPNHPVGMMLLVMRTMKVPGEAGSREVAVWAQQRTTQANDDQTVAQVHAMTADLCREFAAAFGVKPPAGATAPAATSAPASKVAAEPEPATANEPRP